MNRPSSRKMLVVTMVVTGALLVAGIISTFVLLGWQDDQERADCEQRVDGRFGQRVMWEFALEINDNPDDPRAIRFAKELDLRLPVLKCVRVNGHWRAVPVDGNGDEIEVEALRFINAGDE